MEEQSIKRGRSQRISLQVPENVNLVEMSSEEIERLALDMAHKAAATLPPRGALLGIDRLTLTNNAKTGIDVWGEWSRACARTELDPEGLVVNPEIYLSPLEGDISALPSAKLLIKGWKDQ